MNSLMLILALSFLVYLLRHKDNKAVASSSDARPSAPEGQERLVSTQLPLIRQPLAWFRRRDARSRQARWYEYDFGTFVEPPSFQIHFYLPRRVLQIDVFILEGSPSSVKACEGRLDKEWIDFEHAVTYTQYPNASWKVSIILACPQRVQSMRIMVTEELREFRYNVAVRMVKEVTEDFQLLERAGEDLTSDNIARAVEALHQYQALVSDNPKVSLMLARANLKLKHHDQVRYYAAQAMLLEFEWAGLPLYRSAHQEDRFMDVAEIRKLQQASASWQPGEHHGVLALLSERRRLFGMGPGYALRMHEVLEIRREVAARFLNRIDKELIRDERFLCSSLRIIHPDSSIEELDQERFSIGDSLRRNVFIQGGKEKQATWLLPDLTAGDVIEFTFECLVPHGMGPDGQPRLFAVSGLYHHLFPTFTGVAEFRAPVAWELACCPSPLMSANCEQSERDGESVFRYVGEKFIPGGEDGNRYRLSQCEPLVACAAGSSEWDDVFSSNVRRSLGDADISETIHGPLAGIVIGSSNAVEALEQAFYLVRDKLKYGSYFSAQQWINKPGRLAAIFEAGVGDCKDKTYVLLQCARRLGLEHQALFVSTERGTLVEDFPIDQFDHTFLRVRGHDGWLYLDAADDENAFGLPSYNLQGVRALAGSPTGSEIITIPEDDPERNRVEIKETFAAVEGGRLIGEFALTATGRSARYLDERWKGFSLQEANPAAAAAAVLTWYLPQADFDSVTKIANTSSTDMLIASGVHQRLGFVNLNDRLVGVIRWKSPAIATDVWRSYSSSGRLFIPMPLRLEFTLCVRGSAFGRLQDVSSLADLCNPICEIASRVETENGECRVRRSILLKKRVIEGPELDQLPLTLSRLDEALQLALVFKS